jgi:hypothetical protein
VGCRRLWLLMDDESYAVPICLQSDRLFGPKAGFGR